MKKILFIAVLMLFVGCGILECWKPDIKSNPMTSTTIDVTVECVEGHVYYGTLVYAKNQAFFPKLNDDGTPVKCQVVPNGNFIQIKQ
jgi:hypothetical protein